MSDDTEVPLNLQPAPEGFGRKPDGSLIPVADMVQGPSDIQAQYHQDSIPSQFGDVIARNHAAGLDASGHPIPGAVLSDAAKASVAYEASLVSAPPVVVPVPVSVPVRVSGETITPSNDATHVAVPVEHVSAFAKLLAEIESIPQHVRDFWHQHFGQHV